MPRCLSRGLAAFLPIATLFLATLAAAPAARAQEVPPELLEQAARRSGLSPEELRRRYREQAGAADTAGVMPPGRTDLEGIDDRRAGGPEVVLPLDRDGRERPPAPGAADSARTRAAAATGARTAAGATAAAGPGPAGEQPLFGADFFRLDAGVFRPPSFGPVPADYLIGPGDQIVVDVWGEVEFRLERIVDRDGSIILPRGGKISCYGRTLDQVARAIRERLARSYSGISTEPGQGTTFVEVSLGRLRVIRVFVVGEARQPGAYELSSLATVFTALYAAGGAAEGGSLREIRLLRGAESVATLDLYRYLTEGRREGDAILREGDTVFIPPRGKTVGLRGAVRRPLRFELTADEGLADLLRYAGGLRADAVAEAVHVERIVPPQRRRPREPDRTWLDIPLDPATRLPVDPAAAVLLDGDVVLVDGITDRLTDFVEVAGQVKRPGRYEWRAGMTAADLVADAGGLWPDALRERAVVDRTTPDQRLLTFDFPLGAVLDGAAAPVPLAPRDRLRVFSVQAVRDTATVTISGEVRRPLTVEYREGMTLRDLVLRAGGLKRSADLLRAEVSRLSRDAIESRRADEQPGPTVRVLAVELGSDFLASDDPFPLEAHDAVAIRKLPWWELQRTVTVRGEVLYPGIYSLERPDETISSLIARAGGLKPTAFAPGARVVRARAEVGNVALDLVEALKKPGSEHDILLAAGDEIRIPEVPQTVKVIGAVGFPTSIVHQQGKSLGFYVERAGGYAENADKWKTRVIYPNGMSRPIKRIWRDPAVMAGSTILVPERAPREGGGSKLETLKEIAAIMASAATVYLVIDRTTD